MRPTIIVGRTFLSVATLFSSATLLSVGHTFPVGYIFRRHTLLSYRFFCRLHFFIITCFFTLSHLRGQYAHSAHLLSAYKAYFTLPAGHFHAPCAYFTASTKKRQQWALKRPQPPINQSPYQNRCTLPPPSAVLLVLRHIGAVFSLPLCNL